MLPAFWIGSGLYQGSEVSLYHSSREMQKPALTLSPRLGKPKTEEQEKKENWPAETKSKTGRGGTHL